MRNDWVEVSGFPEYEIHPHDGIRRKGKESTLKARTWFGYPKVTLMKDGKKHERRVHKLVAEHFLPNDGGKPIVNHIDSDRSNHSVDNLEWVDNSENQIHRWKTQKEGLSKMKYEREYGLSKVASAAGMYQEKLKCFIEKALKDEISASVFYARASNELNGLGTSEVSEELMNHSKEEMEHFNELLSFASRHGILRDIKIRIDEALVDTSDVREAKSVMRKVQELEKQAIDDYEGMAKCAMKHGDIETARFMKEIMADEIKHFDDLAFVNGDTREIGGLSKLEGIEHDNNEL